LRSAKKRAEAVHAYLVSRGVPSAAMTVTSYGESRPLIVTADGVREPQNRRVEVVVTGPVGR
jgi:outer membrane protein OmpA-like peptidoglycan-associated protein